MKRYNEKLVRKWTVLIILLLALLLTACGSQTTAMKEETSSEAEAAGANDSTEVSSIEAEMSSSEGNGQESLSAESGKAETESEKQESDESNGTSSEDETYIDADYVDKNGLEESEDLSKYHRKSEDTSGQTGSTTVTYEDSPEQENADSTEESENTENDNGGQYSDGSRKTQDEYQTDPVPAGKPNPVEPEDVEIDTDEVMTCILFVECGTILDNWDDLTPGKEELVPSDGIIYGTSEVIFYEGESVYDVLLREMQNNRIHMDSTFTPAYNSAYVKGINNLYEFDCGRWSGWMYCVNGWYPNYGASRYMVKQGDVIEWHYTCDLGRDLGTDVSQW